MLKLYGMHLTLRKDDKMVKGNSKTWMNDDGVQS